MAEVAKNPFDFEGGDLRILVTYDYERLVGNVSTSAMMLASPVWKRFICPPFAQLPDDDEDDDLDGAISQPEEDLVDETKALGMVCKAIRTVAKENGESIVACQKLEIVGPGTDIFKEAEMEEAEDDDSYADEAIIDDTNLFDEDLTAGDFQFMDDNPHPSIDTDNSSTQFQDAQPNTSQAELPTQSTGTIFGDSTAPGEGSVDSIAPRPKKRRIHKVSKSKQLDFTEDDGDALLILLDIAHLKFENIPEKPMSLESLFYLAVLCDKCDCVKLLRPWLFRWYDYTKLFHERSRSLEQLLFVEWALKKDNLNKLTLLAVKTLGLKPSRDYEFQTKKGQGKGAPIDLDHLSPTVLTRVLSVGKATIKKLLDAASEHLRLIESTKCILGQPECVELMYGSLSVKLDQYRLNESSWNGTGIGDSIENIRDSIFRTTTDSAMWKGNLWRCEQEPC